MQLRVDDCTHLNSWLHQWDARFKLIGLLGLMIAFATVDSLWLVPWMGLVVLLLYKLSQLPLSFLIRRLRYPGLFLVGVLLFIPWVSGRIPLWQWGPFTLWQEGCLAALLIAGRFLCSVTVGFIILGTTPFVTLVKAVRSLGLPPLLTDMMLLAYRYLFEILANSNRMRRAMTLRGFGYQGPPSYPPGQTRSNRPPRFQQIQTLAAVTGTLFIRSYEQAERVYNAMRLRGYGYRPSQVQVFQSYSPHRTSQTLRWDAIALIVTLLVATSLILVNHL
ncbi:MAG: cobalt ECF transporter T component CbiQ [Leptolyngbyaceae bacterium]|nr:cobalt ECF transporter T component CbiQ [Leptolyngbyaceae bacterium]